MSWRNIIPPAPELKELKELLPVFHSELPELPEVLTELAMEIYEERAAIMQFEGGLSRADAEMQAALELKHTQDNQLIH